jgi:hypothetical protein
MTERSRRPPVSHDVSVEYKGITYTGSYTVDGNPPFVTVTSSLGSKGTQVGRTAAEDVAKRLLFEMIPNKMRNP